MKKFELVVPAYNEGQNVEAVIRRAVEAAKAQSLSSDDFSLLVVQNGSTDNSAEVLDKLKAGSELGPWFKIVTVVKNQGYGFGLWQGLKASSSDIVGWSHADQQCDPSDAIKAFRMVESSANKKVLVKGERFERSFKDKFVSRVFELFAKVILGVTVYEMNAQPKVFRRELLATVKNPPMTFAFDLYILYQAAKAQYKLETIPVKFPPRIHGLSKWASNFFSRYKTILGMIRYMLELRKTEGRA
jgi:glycosyltransferase involved in cell wall biosynthesis